MVSYEFAIRKIIRDQKVQKARINTLRKLLEESSFHIMMMDIYSSAGLIEDFEREHDICHAAQNAFNEIIGNGGGTE